MLDLRNNKESFVLLWRLLKRTRRFLHEHHKRFCIREVLKTWYEEEATDDFIWEVCNRCELGGWDELPSPAHHPKLHRQILKTVLTFKLRDRSQGVNLRALDAAYSVVYPNSTPINMSKKMKHESGDDCKKGAV